MAFGGNAGVWFFTYPYAILLGGFALSQLLLWLTWKRRSPAEPRWRHWARLLLGVTLTLLTAAGIIAIYARERGQGPLAPLGGSISLLEGVADATPAQSKPELKIAIRCELVTALSSLVKREGVGFLDVTPDQHVISTMLARRGLPSDDPGFHHRIVAWLRERARDVQLPPGAFLYLRKDDLNLVSLTLDHPTVVALLLPTMAEFVSLAPSTAEVVSRWVRRYVGQWNPRLRFTVDNSKSPEPLRIIAVRYDVKTIETLKGSLSVMPGVPGFMFELAFRVGAQRLALTSQDQEVDVPKGEARTLDVVMAPAPNAPVGSVWDGDLTLETNRGDFDAGRFRLETFNSNRPELLKKLGR